MKIFKIILFVLLLLFITSSVVFVFIRYQSERKLSAADEEDAKLAKILFSRVKDIKDVNEPVWTMDEFGNLLDVTNAVTIESNGQATEVTKYEIFKDKFGENVNVKLKKQIEKTKDGKIIESWGFDRPYKMRTRCFLGEIKEIRRNSIVFLVESESGFEEFEIQVYCMENVRDYEKIFDFDEYDLKNDNGFLIPPDSISIGFKRMLTIDDFKKYLNKKVSAQESIVSFFKNSPEAIVLAFKEYY
jgi:hypothetical protein